MLNVSHISPPLSAALEAQLETEHEERTALVREKHELERRIIMLNETTISQDDQEAIMKLKRDLKRTRALLKDTQSQLEKARSEASSKVQIRQLKNQVREVQTFASIRSLLSGFQGAQRSERNGMAGREPLVSVISGYRYGGFSAV